MLHVTSWRPKTDTEILLHWGPIDLFSPTTNITRRQRPLLWTSHVKREHCILLVVTTTYIMYSIFKSKQSRPLTVMFWMHEHKIDCITTINNLSMPYMSIYIIKTANSRSSKFKIINLPMEIRPFQQDRKSHLAVLLSLDKPVFFRLSFWTHSLPQITNAQKISIASIRQQWLHNYWKGKQGCLHCIS